MARYAVGDIQGCFSELQQLLDRVDFNPSRDELWSVGDLVNRGPQSLETLQFFYSLGSSAKVVLGNHDLHLLALSQGIRTLKPGDTLEPILTSPQCATLMDWLRQQPLLRVDRTSNIAMMHAGLAPQWSITQATQLAQEVSSVLTSHDYVHYLQHMYGDTPNRWDEQLASTDRWRVITNYFTRLRFCKADGELDLTTKESAHHPDPAFQPWFALNNRASLGTTILFGHWAALQGETHRDDVIGLDTGCVWGRHLTLLNIDTRERLTCNRLQ